MSKGNKTELIIVISILSVVVIALMIFASYFLITRNSGSNNMKSANPPIVNITSCPQQVTSDSPNVVIEGVMISDAPYCTLTINGEIVATATGKGQIQWSKSYALIAGETREFSIEAKDSNNLMSVQKKTVYCQELNTKKNRAPITPGCTLVKKKSSGLNIREYPGTDYAVVDFINGNDYTSEMVYTGRFRVDYQGYTWYEVVSPKGKHGYVRSDLVQTNTFVD